MNRFLLFFCLIFFPFIVLYANDNGQSRRKMKVFVNGDVDYSKAVEEVDSIVFVVDTNLFDDGKDVHNGHEYVDLGLPSGLLWAACNVGAASPEEYGDYYAWGEDTVKNDYSWSTYKYGENVNSLTKYCVDDSYGSVDDKVVLDSDDDAATVKWGGGWRMPTSDEIKELVDNCTSEWVSLNGVNGRKIVSKINGNYIFIPAAGYYFNGKKDYVGLYAFCWGASLVPTGSYCAWYLYLDSSDVSDLYGSCRNYGLTVRAVCPPIVGNE